MIEMIWQTRDEMENPTNALQSLLESYTRSSKDMSECKFDAWVYGIIVGWDDSSYKELSVKHNWSEEQINYNKLLHYNYCKSWELFIKNENSNTEKVSVDFLEWKEENVGYTFIEGKEGYQFMIAENGIVKEIFNNVSELYKYFINYVYKKQT